MRGAKRKVLFVMSSMNNGGAERALINLLEVLPRERYDLYLYLLNPTGLFLGQVPKDVTVVPTSPTVADCFTSAKGRDTGLRRKLADLVSFAVSRDAETRRGFRWDHFFSRWCESLPGTYDTAVAFINGQVLYFVDEKVDADRKLVFYHSDFRSARFSSEYESPRLGDMDGIYSISERCVEILKEEFPRFAGRMAYLPNISSADTIRRRAEEFIPEEYEYPGLKVLTVARLTHEKGVDIAIRAAAELKSRGVDFRWYELGAYDDESMDKMRALVREVGAEDRFFLLGAKANPYPYIKGCDIVVQPSRYEGKSVFLDEAKILAKPIVATAYPTVHDQIHEGEGIVVDVDHVALADGVQRLLESGDERRSLTKRLCALNFDNSEAVGEYCRAIDGGVRS